MSHSHSHSHSHAHSHGGGGHGHSHAHGGHHDDEHHHHESSSSEVPSDPNKFFDQAADQWENKPGVKEVNQNVVSSLERNLKWSSERWAAATVMDFGAGVGLVSLPLAAKALKVVAVDPSENMLRTLRHRQQRDHQQQPRQPSSSEEKKQQDNNNNNIETLAVILDESTLPQLNGQKFDLIVSSMVAHHLPDLAASIKLLASLLKPQGVLALFDLEHTKETHLFHDHHAKKHAGVFADEGFTAEHMRQLYEQAGLQVFFVQSEFALAKTITETPSEATTPVTSTRQFPILAVFGTHAQQ